MQESIFVLCLISLLLLQYLKTLVLQGFTRKINKSKKENSNFDTLFFVFEQNKNLKKIIYIIYNIINYLNHFFIMNYLHFYQSYYTETLSICKKTLELSL